MEPPGTRLPDLEARLDACLVDHRTRARFTPEWLDSGKRWSDAAWRLRTRAEPVPRDAADIRAIRAFARRPVFICGAHRSGTTMLRDLLDGHPALCVLPAEASHFGALEKQLATLAPEDRTALAGQHWLRRLVNPINQPPFWLLGRSSETASPYGDFAGAYEGFTHLLREASVAAPELAAAACAYGEARGQALAGLAWWVEKTPGTERYLRRIFRELPSARILHVVRDPDEAALSYKALLHRANRDAGSMIGMLRELIRSYRICRRAMQSGPPGRHLALRYDTLVAERAAVMRRVANFLEIDDHPQLRTPRIAGRVATPNSSHAGPPPEPPRWSLMERAALAIARAHYRSLIRAID